MGERDGHYGLRDSEPDLGSYVEQTFLYLVGSFQGAEVGRVLVLRGHQRYDLRAEVDGVQAGSVGRICPRAGQPGGGVLQLNLRLVQPLKGYRLKVHIGLYRQHPLLTLVAVFLEKNFGWDQPANHNVFSKLQ